MAGRNIVPLSDNNNGLGTSSKKWSWLWTYLINGFSVSQTMAASTIPASDSSGFLDTWVRPQCECRFDYTSTTACTLSRYNGYRALVNDIIVSIPAAGVSLSNSGLSASTLYYVYLTPSVTLEASTTAYTTDSRNGIKVKSGDSTRTLVGMVRTDSSTQFSWNLTISYWQRTNKNIKVFYGTLISFGNTSIAVETTSLRVEFLCWADDGPTLAVYGSCSQSASYSMQISLGLDGTAVNAPSMTTGTWFPFAQCVMPDSISNGYHYSDLMACISGGTGYIQSVVNCVQVRG